MNSARETSFETLRVSAEIRPKQLVWLKISGELDIYSYGEFLPELDKFVDKTARALVVDMEDLSFMDSSGVKLLVGFGNQFGFKKVAIYKASRNILRVMRIIASNQQLVYLAGDRDFEYWRDNLETAA